MLAGDERDDEDERGDDDGEESPPESSDGGIARPWIERPGGELEGTQANAFQKTDCGFSRSRYDIRASNRDPGGGKRLDEKEGVIYSINTHIKLIKKSIYKYSKIC